MLKSYLPESLSSMKYNFSVEPKMAPDGLGMEVRIELDWTTQGYDDKSVDDQSVHNKEIIPNDDKSVGRAGENDFEESIAWMKDSADESAEEEDNDDADSVPDLVEADEPVTYSLRPLSFIKGHEQNWEDLQNFDFNEQTGIVTRIPYGSLQKYCIQEGFELVKVNGVSVRPGEIKSMILDQMNHCSVVRLEFDTKDTRIARDAPSRLVLSPVACVPDPTELLDMSESDTVTCVPLDNITKDDPVIVDKKDPLLPECMVSFFSITSTFL